MKLFFIFIYILTKRTIKQESRLSRSWHLCVTVMLRVRLVRTVHFCKGSCSLELQSEGRLHQRRLDYHSGPELSVFTITQKQNVHLYTFVSLSPLCDMCHSDLWFVTSEWSRSEDTGCSCWRGAPWTGEAQNLESHWTHGSLLHLILNKQHVYS